MTTMTRKVSTRVAKMSTRLKVLSAVGGILLAGGAAHAATGWVIGLTNGSSGQSQSANISNLTITAVAFPSPSNLLSPGNDGDVVVTISNPNAYPVTITDVQLPTNLTDATGLHDERSHDDADGVSRHHAERGHVELLDGLEWELAHALHPADGRGERPGEQPARGDDLQNDSSMGSTSPTACSNTYVSMPSLTGVTATGGAATSTTSPATDGWTS